MPVRIRPRKGVTGQVIVRVGASTVNLFPGDKDPARTYADITDEAYVQNQDQLSRQLEFVTFQRLDSKEVESKVAETKDLLNPQREPGPLQDQSNDDGRSAAPSIQDPPADSTQQQSDPTTQDPETDSTSEPASGTAPAAGSQAPTTGAESAPAASSESSPSASPQQSGAAGTQTA